MSIKAATHTFHNASPGHNHADARLANRRVPDQIVREYATRLDHAVVTYNRQDFILLHDRLPRHAGIIVCHADVVTSGLAE